MKGKLSYARLLLLSMAVSDEETLAGNTPSRAVSTGALWF
jgi:hypothetical protein